MSESIESSEVEPNVLKIFQILMKNELFKCSSRKKQNQITKGVINDPKTYILRILRKINKLPLTIETKFHLELLYFIAVKFANDDELTREVGRCYASIGYSPSEQVQARILAILK